MANAVEIANFALARLGAERILSIDDTDSENARYVKIHYTQTVKAVLRSHPWNCVTKRATLAQLETAPAFGYSCAYQLPNDFLRALIVNDDNSHAHRDKWKIESNTLLSDDDSVELIYVYYEEDATLYDELLVEAITVKLAAKLATAITGDPERSAQFLEEFERITRPKAVKVDAVEDRSGENHPLDRLLASSPFTFDGAVPL